MINEVDELFRTISHKNLFILSYSAVIILYFFDFRAIFFQASRWDSSAHGLCTPGRNVWLVTGKRLYRRLPQEFRSRTVPYTWGLQMISTVVLYRVEILKMCHKIPYHVCVCIRSMCVCRHIIFYKKNDIISTLIALTIQYIQIPY